MRVAVATLLWPPDPLAEARRRVTRLRGWLDEDIERAAVLLTEPDAAAAEEQLEVVRERSLQAVRDVFELKRGERALRWNPRRRGDRVAYAEEDERLNSAARQYRHLRTITRIVADLADSDPRPPEDERRRLAGTMRALDAAVVDSLVSPRPSSSASCTTPARSGSRSSSDRWSTTCTHRLRRRSDVALRGFVFCDEDGEQRADVDVALDRQPERLSVRTL